MEDDAPLSESTVELSESQVVVEINKTVFQKNITSKRSLVFHAWVTMSSTLLGFIFGTLLWVTLAVGIVHVRTLDSSLMPWIIASQTIPMLLPDCHWYGQGTAFAGYSADGSDAHL